MEDEDLTPLFALAISLAYVIHADNKASLQEKARLVTVFGKLVETNVMSDGELESMSQKAFAYVSSNALDAFTKNCMKMLTDSQRMAIILNIYDTMFVDGSISKNERVVVEKFCEAFSVDDVTAQGIKTVLMLKNDTSLFTNPSHPLNLKPIDIKGLFRTL